MLTATSTRATGLALGVIVSRHQVSLNRLNASRRGYRVREETSLGRIWRRAPAALLSWCRDS
jgi:hypothetical protein